MFTIPLVSLGQPANDICLNNTNIGSLPTPGTCVAGLQDGAQVTINGTTVGANPEFPYPSATGSCAGSISGTSNPANDVWYSFTSTGTTLNFDITGLPNANVVIYEGGVCGAFQYVRGCMKADAAGNGNFSITPVGVGATFYAQVSSDDTTNASDGPFTLRIDNDIDCDNCFRNGTLTANPAPLNGTYQPGQVVSFCFEVTEWEQMNTNWFHGVQLDFGTGWNGVVSNPTPANTCMTVPGGPPHGSWDYYPAGIGVVNGTNWTRGFYFTEANNPIGPAFSYGDDCGGNTVSWTFCWDLTVTAGCDPNADLSVTINTSGDGESGSWMSPACIPDEPFTFNATKEDIPPVYPSINSPLCIGDNLQLTCNTVAGGTYSWTGPNGFTAAIQNPTRNNITANDTGFYVLTITRNGCTNTDSVKLNLKSILVLNPVSNSPICQGDTLKITVDTITGATYSWTGPLGYTSPNQNISRPNGLSSFSGKYYINTTANGCSGTDSITVTVNVPAKATAYSNSPVCLDSSIIFSAQFAVGATYSWTGPNGFTSAIRNPTINQAALINQGQYILEVMLNGCPSYDTINVIVNTPPSAVANANTPLCEGDTLRLTANTVAGATYEWTGPNGFTSVIQNPTINTVTLAMSGSYILTTTLNGCPAHDTIAVVINFTPTINTSSNTPICEGDSIFLFSGNNSATTYAWSGPNGFTANISNPKIGNTSVINSGDYMLTLSLNGCSIIDTTTVTVNPTPTIIAGSNTPVCENDTLFLTANGTAGSSYSWTGPNGFTSVLQNPFIANTSAVHNGRYYVTTTLGSCSAIDSTDVIITPLPTLTVTSNNPVCENDTLFLNAGNSTAATYSWTGPNGFTSNLENPFVPNFTSALNGFYVLEISENGCTNSDSVNITAQGIPLIVMGSNAPICELDTLRLTANFIAGATYSWSGPNGFTSAIQNPSINNVTVLNSGDYYLTISNLGCSSTDTLSIIIDPKPTSIAGSNSPVCEGDPLNLTAGFVPAASYDWTGPNAFNSNLQNPSLTPAALNMTGNYILTTNLNDCMTSDTISVIINPIPTVTITASDSLCETDTLFLNANTVAGATYGWTGPNGFNSVLQNPVINSVNASHIGEYILTITLNGCSNTDTLDFFVKPKPNAIAGSNSPICEGDDINLTTNAIVGATYSWSGPNGYSSAVQNPTLTPSALNMSGDYYLAIDLNGCLSYDTINVTVNPLPNVNANSALVVCQFDSISLSTPIVVGATYQWTGPNGYTSNNSDSTFFAGSTNLSGTYKIVVTLNGCSDSTEINVTVNETPQAIANGNTPLCERDTLNLTANNITSGTFNWTGPNGFTSILQNPSLNGVTLTNAGWYYLTTTHTTNGCFSIDSVEITINPTPTAIAGSNSPVCEEDTIFLTANNDPLASYNWTGPNGFTSVIQNPFIPNAQLINTGQYIVTLSTAQGCSDSDTINLIINPKPNAVAGSNSPICEGEDLNLTANTIVGATYSWSGPNGYSSAIQNPTLTPSVISMSGDYYLAIDLNGCISYDTVNVIVNPLPNVNANSALVVCQFDSISLSTPIVGGATYQWTGPNGYTSNSNDTTFYADVTTLSGTYKVIVTLNGCSDSTEINVTVNETPDAVANGNTPLCERDTLNLTANNITSGTFSWTGPNGFTSALQNPSINGVTSANAGWYYVTTTHPTNGCFDVDSVEITINYTPTAIAGSNSPICEQDTIFLTANNDPLASYNWTGPNGFTSIIQNPFIPNAQLINSGQYIVTLSTAFGCIDSDTINVLVNPKPIADVGTDQTLCDNDTLFLTAQNQSGATYNWTGPNGFTSVIQNPFIPNVNATHGGLYILTVTLNGCTDEDTVDITINPNPSAIANSNTPVCEDDTLRITSNQVTGATYQWTGPNGFTSINQNDSIVPVSLLANGDYYLEITLNGCTSYDTTSVVIVPKPIAISTSNSPVCEHDTIRLTSNFIAGATYYWTGPNGFISINQHDSIINADLIHAGDYILTITENGCSTSDTTNVIINPIPTANAGSNAPLCINDTLRLTANTVAGATYSWSGPNGFTSGLQNPTINTVTAAMSGNYFLEVELNGCVGYDTITVNIGVNLLINANGNSPVCEGDSIILSVTNVVGASYSWTGPNGFTSILQNPKIPNSTLAMDGRYFVTASQPSGCNGIDSIDIVITPLPQINLSSNNPICQDDTIFLNTINFPGVNYSWTGPNGFTSNIHNPFIPNAQTTMDGYYVLTATANGCSAIDSILIRVTPLPTINASSNSPICNGDTIKLFNNIVPGATYNWSGPNGFNQVGSNPFILDAQPIDDGDYYLEIISGGCSNFDTTSVVILPLPVVVANGNTPVCQDDTLFLTSNAIIGATYQWTGPNGYVATTQNAILPNIKLADAGQYIVRAEVNGCYGYDTLDVQVLPLPVAIANSNSPVCIGDTIYLTAANSVGATYSWIGPNGFISALQNPFIPNATALASGNYILTTLLNGCPNRDTVTVLVTPIVPATINPAGPFCYNDAQVILTAVNPGGQWSGNGIINAGIGDFSPVFAGAGTHTITYISPGACPDTQSINIIVHPQQNTQVVLDQTIGCAPLTVNGTTTNIGNLDCKWFIDNNPVSDNCIGFTEIFTTEGCFDLRLDIIDANGCSNTVVYPDTICTHPIPQALFDYPNKKYTIFNSTVDFFNNSINGDTYLWTFMGINTTNLVDPTYTFPDVAGDYEVCLEVTSINGCKDTLCKDVSIVDVPYFYVPNAFTPNKDGFNDVFQPIISEVNIEQYEFQIFNRWGQLLFETKELNEGWDGMYQGLLSQTDTYVWKVKLKETNDIEVKVYIGHFSIVR